MTLWTVACQTPLSRGFSRPEYWSGLPFPSPGALPAQGLNPGLPHCRQILYCLNHQGSPYLPSIPSGSFIVARHVAQVVKNPPANAGDIRDTSSISGSGRSLEEGMATHSSILAWRIPWTEEPGGLQSIGSQRVRHNCSDLPPRT